MSADPIFRLRRSRAKGARLPAGTVCVDRSTPWGNPFVVGKDGTAAECVRFHRILVCDGLGCFLNSATLEDQRAYFNYVRTHIQELRGKNLACWCTIGKPCHADTLMELANA